MGKMSQKVRNYAVAGLAGLAIGGVGGVVGNRYISGPDTRKGIDYIDTVPGITVHTVKPYKDSTGGTRHFTKETELTAEGPEQDTIGFDPNSIGPKNMKPLESFLEEHGYSARIVDGKYGKILRINRIEE